MPKTLSESSAAENATFRPAVDPTPVEPVDRTARHAEAVALVKGYLGWTAGAGLLPIPAADVVLVTALQLRMLTKLSRLYGVPFKKNAAKSIVAALLGSAVPASLASGISSAAKAAPGVGTIVGVVTMPALAAASTYAVGKVFITHFEAGGTFLDFDVDKMREYFASEFNKARNKTTNDAPVA
jgi:uncharacterized protein (DUF697 family)